MNRREALRHIFILGAGGAPTAWGIFPDKSEQALQIQAKEAERVRLADELYAEGKAVKGLFSGTILDEDDPRVKELTNLLSQQLVLGRQLNEERGVFLSSLYRLKPIALILGGLSSMVGLVDLIDSLRLTTPRKVE